MVAGGTVEADIECQALSLSSGSIAGFVDCSKLTTTGGAIKGSIFCSGNITINGGTVKGDVNCSNTLTVLRGAISNNGKYSLVTCTNFIMKGGKIVSTNAERGILIGSANSTKKYSAKISGGTITCKSPIYDGICLDNTNMTMTGGSIVITDFYDCGISSHGGKITIKGGTVSVTTKRKKAYGAFAVDSMTNKAACLKAITGPLPDGASFKSKGNVYKVFNYANDVSIQQYGAKSTTPVFEKVRFGGRGYDVKGVCSNAFNTAAGKKVTKIRFNNSLRNIGAKAFAGAKSLSKLEIYCFSLDYKYDGRGQLKSAKWSRDSKVAKKAFANCGRKKGAGVTILIGIACTNNIPIYKKLLVGKSLSPRAKILAP